MRINFGHPSNRGMMAYYDMTEKFVTDVRDLTGGNHTAAGTNIVQSDWVLSSGNNYGYTLAFDGSTKYLTANDINLNNPSGNHTGEVTISAWIFPSGIDGTIVKQYEDDWVGNLDGVNQYYSVTNNSGLEVGGDNCIGKEDAGSNSLFIAAVNKSGIQPTGDYSISNWAYENPNFTRIRDKVAIWDSSPDSKVYEIRTDSVGDLRFVFSETSGITLQTKALNAGAAPIGEWYHQVVTFTKATNVARLYLNGNVNPLAAVTGDYPGSGLSDGDSIFEIGSAKGSAVLTYDGRIGPTAIWNRVISTGDISTLYNQGTSALLYSGYAGSLLENLEAHWDLTEVQGGPRFDSTANAHTATEVGGAVANRLGFSNHKSFTAISSWKLDTKADDMVIMGNYDGSSDGREWMLNTDIGDPNQLEFRVNSHGGTGLMRADNTFPIHETGINSTVGNIATDQWIFTVCGYNADTDRLTLDVNNSGVQSGIWINGVNGLSDSMDFTIGAADVSGLGVEDYFDGVQTQVAMWDRVLTTGETNYIYNNGETLSYEQIGISGTVGSGLKTNLVSWWRLDGINDSHSGNDLTNNNTILFNTEGNSADDTLRKSYRVNLKSPSGIVFGINDNEYVFSGVIDNGNWHHVVATFNGDVSATLSGQKVYVDGIEATGGVLSSGLNQSSINNALVNTTIAKQQNVSTQNYDGKIRNIRIYSRAFSPTDVKQLYSLEKK